MSANGINFGGHTVNHPFLSRLTSDGFLWEVSECKRRIEDELQLPADYFAYPNGREEDFGLSNKTLIRQAGYRAAVTTIWGVNYSSTDPFELGGADLGKTIRRCLRTSWTGTNWWKDKSGTF